MAGGRSDDDDVRTGDGAVQVELDGLPTRSSLSTGRVARWSGPAMVLVGLLWLGVAVASSDDPLRPWLATGWVVLGVISTAAARRTRVELEPTGFRLCGWRRGRLRPWSSVHDVDPGNPRWSTPAELRLGDAGVGAVPLAAMSREQAEELRRRLHAARAGTGADA
ncbi:hypothetical protein [Pseudokineococcus lusitanus]|uniref:Uncharacterized protein n=1 Tax=Pseudokineococcus lusitanus TaxID=763993 RepID=A0A3N1HTP1_9ACTN|nr:hypothetical protein [Pseudokineococcus lusitanus]ROP45894.1 hypothetical protein EDC03_0506 [Pseudokineococcus lusitanus]